METDRDVSGGDELPSRPDPVASPHDYGYGQTPLDAAGVSGPRAADSGLTEGEAPSAADAAADAAPEASGTARSSSVTAPGTDAGARADVEAVEAGGENSLDPEGEGVHATGMRPVTALRTAPRAVLRPVPEGFPTPPPRPARPNRRPAPKLEPAPAGGKPRGLLIAGISVVAVLLLTVLAGGGVLAYRALSPSVPAAGPSAPEAETPQEPAGPGSVQIGEVSITEKSTEVGVRKVGGPSSAMEPEGEYIVVIFEVDNPRDSGVDIADQVELETADGTSYAPDSTASVKFEADSRSFGIVESHGTATFHKVYDVPIGTQPVGLHFAFSMVDETGTLPLGS